MLSDFQKNRIAPISETEAQTTRLLIRCDDIGMCHAVNMAIKKLIETDIPFSVSVMFACPWYQEAVDILKAYPKVSVGVHLTLNSEWLYYKWGPISGREGVPSLVDSNGYFFETITQFLENNPKMNEVGKELRAQIERALQSGLRIDYMDFHIGSAIATPELREFFEKLAKEYNLGISGCFNEIYYTIFHDPIEDKTDSLVEIVNNLQKDKINLVVFHLGLENPEMNALVDMNWKPMTSPEGISLVSRHRHAELKALCSKEFKEAIKRNNIHLITYHNLISEVGLKAMERLNWRLDIED